MPAVRVLLLDPNHVFRRGMRSLLEEAPEVTVVGEAVEGRESLDLIRALAPDVLLTEAKLPDMTGVEVVRRLRGQEASSEEQASTRVLVLSACEEARSVQGMLEQEVAGYRVPDQR